MLTRTALGLEFDAKRFDQFHCFVEDYCLQCHAAEYGVWVVPAVATHANATFKRARRALGRLRRLPEAARPQVAQAVPGIHDRMTAERERDPALSPASAAPSRLRRTVGISLFRARRLAGRRPRGVRERGEQRIVDRFHRLFYDRLETTWTDTHWLGTGVLKCPFDLWMYQEILVDMRPDS